MCTLARQWWRCYTVSLGGVEAVSTGLAGSGDECFCLTSVYCSSSSNAVVFLNDLYLTTNSVKCGNHTITGNLHINTLKHESSGYLGPFTNRTLLI